MPGPRNSQKKRKSGNKQSQPRLSIESVSSASSTESQDVVRTPSPIQDATTVSPEIVDERRDFPGEIPGVLAEQSQEDLVQKPFIHDPGNGHREEVLQMLCTVLPEETALILWYNKSRATSRICPACQRLYDFTESEEYDRNPHQRVPPQLAREQELSGLCSAICFVLASYNYPAAIKSAWGHSAEEMDEGAWQDLNSAGEGHAPSPRRRWLGNACAYDARRLEAESTVPTESGHTWTEAYVSEAPQAGPLRV
ncbi:hypothetical protein R3P38DRAFT_2931568 [Favolaschia claudopus]|uniref:Uncharacterized protein n=1 Tax=Favolaschia claudopus TaxID=2862362 RepID=A0AAW0BT48_9AGAR